MSKIFHRVKEAVMGELNRAERLQIMLTPAELTLVDNWRFSRRMPSRAAAVRELLKRGLMADGISGGPHGGARGRGRPAQARLDGGRICGGRRRRDVERLRIDANREITNQPLRPKIRAREFTSPPH